MPYAQDLVHLQICVHQFGRGWFGMLQSMHCANCQSSIKNCCKLASLTTLTNHEE